MENKVGNQFLEMSKSRNMPASAQIQGLPQPPLELPVPSDSELIDLPSPSQIKVPFIDLRQAIEKRETLQGSYTETNISLLELSYLLWITQE